MDRHKLPFWKVALGPICSAYPDQLSGPHRANYPPCNRFRGNALCQQKSQADKADGGIDFANHVTSDDGSMPIDMTPDTELEPMA